MWAFFQSIGECFACAIVNACDQVPVAIAGGFQWADKIYFSHFEGTFWGVQVDPWVISQRQFVKWAKNTETKFFFSFFSEKVSDNLITLLYRKECQAFLIMTEIFVDNFNNIA